MRPALLAMLHSATDREFGVEVEIRPQHGGGYTIGEDDPTRPSKIIIGEVDRIPFSIQGKGERTGSGGNAAAVIPTTTVKFTSSALNYKVIAGDIVILLQDENKPSFKVDRVQNYYTTNETMLFLVSRTK